MGGEESTPYRPPQAFVAGCGSLSVQVEKPFYQPGETVFAKVYLKVDSPQGGIKTGEYGGLTVEISGDERAEWTRHYTRSHGSGKNRRTTHHQERHHMHREVFSFDAGELNPANGFFPNGLHEATICFDLPSTCPSSMLYNSHATRERPLVAITYSVRAEMITEEMILKDNKDPEAQRWGSDKMFMVREAAVVVLGDKAKK